MKKVNLYAKFNIGVIQSSELPGSLGDASRFARARKLPVGKVRQKLKADLG